MDTLGFLASLRSFSHPLCCSPPPRVPLHDGTSWDSVILSDAFFIYTHTPCQHVCSHVLKCIHALTHSNCMSLAMNSLLNLNSLPDNFHWQSSRISISKRNILNSCFPNFSSHSISQLCKWQLLWESIALIFSHPLSNPLSSYWLHIPNISESRFSSPPPSALVWIIIKATRLPLLPDLLSSVSSWLSSQSNPLKMRDKSCHSTTAHPEGNENSTISMWSMLLLLFCLISHTSPSLSILSSNTGLLTVPRTSQAASFPSAWKTLLDLPRDMSRALVISHDSPEKQIQ